MDLNEEELSETNKQSSRQSLNFKSSDYRKSPSMADEESDIKKSISSKDVTSDEDEEDNSTVDKFDSNYENFKPSHTSIDYNLEKPNDNLTVPSSYQAPSSSKKGRSLSIASVLSPLSPSNSPNINRNVPQFLTVSPTFTPRARPPPAYLGNYTGGLSSLTGPSNMINNSTSRLMNPSLAVGGQMPSFQAAKGGILGSATSQLLNSRSRHQSIDAVKISTGNNQVLSSHLARKRQSVVSAKILETLATANANYSGCRRLVRGQTCYGSGSGPSTYYFSPGRLTENLKESYDEEQDELKENLFENTYRNSDEPKKLIEKNSSLETPVYKQRFSILTSASNTTGEEKENQFDEETMNNKNEENLIDYKNSNEHVKISFDAGKNEKLSKINEDDIGNKSDQEGEPEAPTLSLGERIVWVKTAGPEYGTVRWIGRMPKVSTKWTIGVEFDNAIGSGDGIIDGKRFFNSKDNYAKFLPLASVTKLEAYLARPRSGTLLSRMSVQLKPGQLISVQRTPSINHIPVHCALNAPHHIDHDVHKTNMQHCLCNNCNHPCAHLCHTKNYKGSKKKERAHMCHFSQKPHNKLCCGGEDLRHLIASGKLEKAGGLLQEILPIKTESKNEQASMSNENDIQTLSFYNFKTLNIQKAKNSIAKKSDNFSDINYNNTKSSKVSSQDSLLTSSVSSTSVFYDHVSQNNNVKSTMQIDLEKKNNNSTKDTNSRIAQDIKTDLNVFIDTIDLKSIDDSTSFSMLSLNSNSLNQTSNLSSENQTSPSKINSSLLSQSQMSVFSDSNKTSCSKTPLDSVTTSSSSINSFSSINPQNTSSTISGLVSFSPCKRRKKPPAPKPPGFKDKNQSHDKSNIDLSNNKNNLNTKTLGSVSKTLNNLDSNISKNNLSSKKTINDKNIVAQNLINSSNNNSLPHSVDIKTFKKRKKSSKSKPAPVPPVLNSNLTTINKSNQNNLLNSKLSEKNTKSLKPKIKNLSLNNVHSCLRPNNSNNTTPSISASSTHYSAKFNVKQRLNAILNRSLSEAFKLNAKAALSSVQHSFSSEVNLNKKNIFSFMNNTAFNDSFNCEQQVMSPELIEKNVDLNKVSKNSDSKSIEKNYSFNKNKKEELLTNSNVKSSPLNFNVMDHAILSIASYSDKLVNQLFTTQNTRCELKNRSFSMPYLVFLPKNNENESLILPVNMNKPKTRKRKSAFNLANDLIIETLSKSLYNGSADQLLYAAELLEEFSENNIVAVPPLSSTLAALISPNHYKKHNLNNQLLLINHYVDCLKHEQEQEELLTVQLIEQQQVDKMFVEVSKKSVKKNSDESILTIKEIEEKKLETFISNSDKRDKNIKVSSKNNLNNCTNSLKKNTEDCDIKQEKTDIFLNPHNSCAKSCVSSSHESSAGSDELHSDTSDGKVTVKSMHTNRLSNLPILADTPVSCEENLKKNLSENINKEVKDKKKLIKNLNSSSSTSINHHENNCTRHNFLKKRPCCLEHSQSTYCLSEHYSCGHISNESEETSSSSSTQSSRSTEESIVFKHPHSNCFNFNTEKFYSEKNFTHSLRRNLNKNYINSSFSDLSSDDTFSNNKSPQLFFSQNKCFHHSNINLTDQSLCACCIHNYDLKQGSLPTKYLKNNSSFKNTRLPDNLCKSEELFKNLNNSYNNEELSQNHFCQQKNFPDKISRLYDYHCSQLEDMFKPDNNNIVDNELTDLMDQLEVAISSGEHKKAAILARELALRKVTCSLQRSKKENVISQPIVVYLYIEDQKTHQGPIPIQVYPTMTVKALKLKIQKEFGFDSSMQKWILGKSLASNEDASLLTYGVTTSGWPIFLYLFNSEEIIVNHDKYLSNKIDQNNYNFLNMNESYEKQQKNFIENNLTNINKPDFGLQNQNDFNFSSLEINQKPIKKIELDNTKPTSYRYEQQNILIDEEQDFFPPPPPPIMFQSTNDEDTTNFLIDVEPTTWVNNKLHESVKIKKNKLNNKNIYKKVEDEIDEYESANENLLEDENLIEEILIEEEIYEDDKVLGSDKQNEKKSKETTKIYQAYNDLINLNNVSLVKNTDQFECPVCLTDVEKNEGIILKNCLHSFCKNCLIYCVEHCDQTIVNCPFSSDLYQCESEISPQEIRALLKDNLKIFENHLNKSVKIVSMNKLVFHCKTTNCDGFTFYENSAKWFLCPLCTTLYCLRCQLAHDENQICKDTEQEKQKELSEEEKKSQLFINDLIKRNQALNCPKCEVLVMKKWGCDWVKCSMCKTEICWVTKKARWGPAGKGDISDGCKCMVNNIKCHPKCNYCH